ncbi:PriCT-2 domain-containing protein [Massilia sp. CMS3.1]|uniref:PriCT-2 domain-containing protein n=1 Tax=Massilia sp. CMS3.1 TaxID=3373083 RepID=UPI003EE70950
MATLDVSAIPGELAVRPQWLVWKFEPGEKKPKKMPYYVSGQRRTGKQGSDEDRAELVTLEVAMQRVGQGYSGVGFAFLPGDGLIGVDIDGCIDEDGVVAPRAAAIITACNSYTEYSPSRKGVHIIVAGETKTFKSNEIGLEVFCAAQFFTFTAEPFPGAPAGIADIDPGVLNRLRATVEQARAVQVKQRPQLAPTAQDERSRLESALTQISPDCGYDDWFRIGMGIYSALGESGLSVWDWWSSKSAKYPGTHELEKHWKSFEGTRVTAATVYKLAVDAGWRPPRSASPPMPPRVLDASADSPIPFADETAGQGELPHPPQTAEPAVMSGIFTLEWALAHCALVQGSTDVWDSLNKLRMKRGAFVDMVGKAAAATWSSHDERRNISPRNLPKTIRGVAVDDGGAGADNHIVMMLDRYTLLYGTKTVWDAEKRTVIAYDAMALARSSDLASRWISHPMHREVDLDKLVFDPTQRVDLDTHINMFEGFPLKPKKDEAKAQLALGLLHSLCSSEPNCDEIFHWILCWLAYPLQHPGAKMQTAILMFGEKQGTGKSLFFEGIVKPIYGAHGATGGQHQLEAQYTHWRSQKLFVLFEEILSRQDKYSHFGLIKHMITGRDMPISQKFKDDRTEANHMNVVMLSNEFQAVPIEPEDRRFQVAEARNPLDPLLLAKIQTALADGLSEAFYAFLLEYPLAGFTPHTKPIMTASKERMINFGRPDWEAFYLAWKDGDLSVPYCSCLSEHLYVMYGRYCSRFGFKALSLTKFSELIAQRVKKDRQWVSIGGAAKKLLTVLHVPQPEDEPTETLSQQCERFFKLADIKGTA